MGPSYRVIGLLVVVFAILYQVNLRELLFATVGLGRTIQPIDDFPFTCRRLRHERLEACEDMWLDDDARVLYAACAGSLSRSNLLQSVDRLNVSGRRSTGSELIALHIDSPGPDSFFGMHNITPVGYDGATGDGTLDLLGFDAEVVDASTLRFWLINQRPPVDAKRRTVDATKTGVNSTIELFELKRSASEMIHIKTVFDPEIYSPNGITALGGGSFVVSNDHSVKVGIRKKLDLFLGGGNVVYCPSSGSCLPATPKNLIYPNGLERGLDGLVYIPSAASDAIRVMEPQVGGALRQLEVIKLGMPVDNLAVDAKGDIYAAGLPKVRGIVASVADPFNRQSPSTVWRISRTAEGYRTEKIIEDRDKRVLSGVSVARHDVKTGRLFMGGPVTPYLMVCDPK
ncbi:serum paraoxonase/arylesteras-like protein [Lophium mytilinum]|uniref:Serum paraoxonase/arylesteras-like protein n=1 Tax=Lophium mytilinum TaxID=390894 RepID=A0A6A6QJ04_9PEZI|nr:serum paraoxonase/arylesteras-like protein [Lophium mytilinum]